MNLGYLDATASFGPSRYGFGDATASEVPEVVGGLVAANQADPSGWRSIRVGVTTGVLIHLVIRAINAVLGSQK